MTTHTGYVMTLANSIIGVSLLAMPYCFKQCGIILGIVLLIFSNIVTRLACHFLIKSATMCRRTSFEFVAYHAFGVSGKLLVELGVIGFMMGTSVALFVVIGDLAPMIISKMFFLENNQMFRIVTLVVTGVLIIFPLSLLRNIESLAAVSTLSMLFYMTLLLKVLTESFPHLAAANTAWGVNYWRPEGILQCFPIFSVALSCQTQIFEILEVLPNPSLERMNSVVRSAVGLCTVIYILNGCLGYIAFAREPFGGNILLSFTPSLSTDLFQLGFVMSVILGFPIVVFPCRASLNSLLFKQGHQYQDLNSQSKFIPDTRFKLLTAAIVGVALCTGILVPNIELVLGFVGSTIGVAICLIFPSGAYIHIQGKKTSERLVAKITLGLGIVVMVLGTYSNLETAAGKNVVVPVEFPLNPKPPNLPEIPVLQPVPKDPFGPLNMEKVSSDVQKVKPTSAVPDLEKIENRKEPPNPRAPVEQKIESVKAVSPANDAAVGVKGKVNVPESDISVKKVISPEPPIQVNIEKSAVDSKKVVNPEDKSAAKEINKIHQDAIAKEEHELKENTNQQKREEEQKQKELLDKLQQHQEEQKKLLEEQQSILDEMKNRDKKSEAVEAIKPEKFNDNIEKIQEVIDDLKERKQVMDKNKVEKIAEEKKKIAERKIKEDLVENIILKAEAFIKLPESVVSIEKKNISTINKTKIDVPIVQKEVHKEPAAAGRDILEDKTLASKEREKRDVDEVNNEDSCKKSENKIETEVVNLLKNAADQEKVSRDFNKLKEERIQQTDHLSPPQNVKLPNKSIHKDGVSVDIAEQKQDMRRRRK